MSSQVVDSCRLHLPVCSIDFTYRSTDFRGCCCIADVDPLECRQTLKDVANKTPISEMLVHSGCHRDSEAGRYTTSPGAMNLLSREGADSIRERSNQEDAIFVGTVHVPGLAEGAGLRSTKRPL